MKFRDLSGAVFGLALVTTQTATFTVTTTDDSGPGSLCQAILDPNEGAFEFSFRPMKSQPIA